MFWSVKRKPESFRKNPAANPPDPKTLLLVWVSATALPSLSTTERCVVSPSSSPARSPAASKAGDGPDARTDRERLARWDTDRRGRRRQAALRCQRAAHRRARLWRAPAAPRPARGASPRTPPTRCRGPEPPPSSGPRSPATPTVQLAWPKPARRTRLPSASGAPSPSGRGVRAVRDRAAPASRSREAAPRAPCSPGSRCRQRRLHCGSNARRSSRRAGWPPALSAATSASAVGPSIESLRGPPLATRRSDSANAGLRRICPGCSGLPSGNIRAWASGNGFIFASSPAMNPARICPTGKPSSASRIAGAMTVASGSLPYFPCKVSSPATSPGMATTRRSPGFRGRGPETPGRVPIPAPVPAAALEQAPYARARRRRAAQHRNRGTTGCLSRWSQTLATPLPPRPDICGSTTPIANAVATAASTALPPARSMATPASLASALADATTPFAPSTRRPASAGGVTNPDAPASLPGGASRGQRAQCRHDKAGAGESADSRCCAVSFAIEPPMDTQHACSSRLWQAALRGEPSVPRDVRCKDRAAAVARSARNPSRPRRDAGHAAPRASGLRDVPSHLRQQAQDRQR